MRVIIVDDEPLAREGIREFLGDEPDIEIVAECSSGIEALEAIEAESPDLVFLDVQMPELDGFGVLDALEPDETPAVIFITAHDKYALKAFDVFALDYLLKPLERSRFTAAVERARQQLSGDGLGDLRKRMLGLIADLEGKRTTPLDRLVVKSRGRVHLLKVSEIDWIEADGNYARLHVGDEDHLVRETMTALERRLDAGQFVRIHRSTIVNLDRIREIQPWFKGELMVILTGGEQLSLSRKYRKALQERLGQHL